MQLWDIVHLKNRNGHCNILLTYLGFITQRIYKVDARTALIYVFDALIYVFDAEPTRKYVSSRNLTGKTQAISYWDITEECCLNGSTRRLCWLFCCVGYFQQVRRGCNGV